MQIQGQTKVRCHPLWEPLIIILAPQVGECGDGRLGLTICLTVSPSHLIFTSLRSHSHQSGLTPTFSASHAFVSHFLALCISPKFFVWMIWNICAYHEDIKPMPHHFFNPCPNKQHLKKHFWHSQGSQKGSFDTKHSFWRSQGLIEKNILR